MKIHSQYCQVCRKITMFVRKLINPSDPNCTKIIDNCFDCNNHFKITE